uniref:Uncharacterized protein n=1 Tax=Opuntia streptacantha TaxID=393608 RepID=A0A7C8ZSL3_OPUST
MALCLKESIQRICMTNMNLGYKMTNCQVLHNKKRGLLLSLCSSESKPPTNKTHVFLPLFFSRSNLFIKSIRMPTKARSNLSPNKQWFMTTYIGGKIQSTRMFLQ